MSTCSWNTKERWLKTYQHITYTTWRPQKLERWKKGTGSLWEKTLRKPDRLRWFGSNVENLERREIGLSLKTAARKKPSTCRMHRWKLKDPRTDLFLEAHHVKGIAHLLVFLLPVLSYILCTKSSTYVPEKVYIPYKTVTQPAQQVSPAPKEQSRSAAVETWKGKKLFQGDATKKRLQTSQLPWWPVRSLHAAPFRSRFSFHSFVYLYQAPQIEPQGRGIGSIMLLSPPSPIMKTKLVLEVPVEWGIQ